MPAGTKRVRDEVDSDTESNEPVTQPSPPSKKSKKSSNATRQKEEFNKRWCVDERTDEEVLSTSLLRMTSSHND